MGYDADILIIGAGPAGSAAAAHLARGGLRVLLIDRARFPREKACSEYMSPEAIRLLDRLGVVQELVASGARPLAGTMVVAPGGARLTGLFEGAHQGAGNGGPRTGLSVARRVLDERLLRAAGRSGAQIREGCAALRLIAADGCVRGAVVQEVDGRQIEVHARLTIGADGLHSLMARHIGRRRHGALQRFAFVAHVGDVMGLGAQAEMHVGPSGYVGLNAIGPGIANVALVVPRGEVRPARGRTAEFFFDRLERFPGVRGRVSPDRLVRQVMVTGPFAAWSSRVAVAGALLVGDAADFFDPFTGDGILTALKGAELAANAAMRALERGGLARARDLAPYARDRRRAFAGKWAVERMIGYAMAAPSLFDRAVERLGRKPGMADTLLGVTAGLLPARAALNPLFLARMTF